MSFPCPTQTSVSVRLHHLQAAIRKELNDYKSTEMEVHEESRIYTRFVFGLSFMNIVQPHYECVSYEYYAAVIHSCAEDCDCQSVVVFHSFAFPLDGV